MLTFDDKGGRGVRKHPKHADVIYEWFLNRTGAVHCGIRDAMGNPRNPFPEVLGLFSPPPCPPRSHVI